MLVEPRWVYTPGEPVTGMCRYHHCIAFLTLDPATRRTHAVHVLDLQRRCLVRTFEVEQVPPNFHANNGALAFIGSHVLYTTDGMPVPHPLSVNASFGGRLILARVSRISPSR